MCLSDHVRAIRQLTLGRINLSLRHVRGNLMVYVLVIQETRTKRRWAVHRSNGERFVNTRHTDAGS